MTRRIRLSRSRVETMNVQYFGAQRLRIVADGAEGMDARVFLFRRNPADPYTGEAEDTFLTVCSPVDLAEYPPEEPAVGAARPYFRKSVVDLLLRSTREAEEVWQSIQTEVCVLRVALNRLDDLGEPAVIWCGGAPDADSDSDSDSDSSDGSSDSSSDSV